MVLGGQGLEPEEAPTIVQVVYYLSRAGQLLQPHLIDVPVSPHSNGLYLRDVKKKMTAIRGKGVADSFSWSCKRNYKDNFIWQDLSDDDKILPLSDGEFVLKGSGLYAGYRVKSDNYLSEGQLEPESTSFSPQHAAKFTTPEPKKFDFEAVKRSLDLQTDQHQEQNDLAAALSLSLQIMNNSNSHLKNFSKDKSMDLNQQVMNSLSQAKTGPAEECILDHYEMSSSETFLSEESSGQNHSQNHSREITRERIKSTSSSSRTELNYDSAREVGSKDGSVNHSRDLSKIDRPNIVVGKGRQEKPDELPSIKTKKSTSGEIGESLPFVLSPRRLMAALSNPGEKKTGRMLHSISTRSSTMSTTTSNQSDPEPLSAIKLTKQATCLSQLRLCSHLNHHATDSRPDSPVRQSGPLSGSVQQSSPMPRSPSSRGNSGPYWARWKPGRKSRPQETKVFATESSAESLAAEDSRRALQTSFEFDRPVQVASAMVGSPSLTQNANILSSTNSFNSNISHSGRKITPSSSGVSFSADKLSEDAVNLSPTTLSSAEATAAISVKEIISQLTPTQSKPGEVGLNNFNNDTSRKEAIESVPDGGQNFSVDSESLPRVSISDEITAARETVRTNRPESPESPLQANPPCSPARTISPARTGASPASFHKRTADGRARARGMVKEVSSRDSRFMKDLAKELERAKGSSGTMRSLANSKRIPSIRNGPAGIGVRSISSSFSRSPPRISSMLWEDPPRTPKKDDVFVNRDERPLTAGRSNLDWEKTLQEAASFSLPPPDFGQILQECGQCGRTFKPDSLKVHMRGCRGLRRSKDFQSFNGSTLAMRAHQ